MYDCVLLFDITGCFPNACGPDGGGQRHVRPRKRRGAREFEAVKQIHTFCSIAILNYSKKKRNYSLFYCNDRFLAFSTINCYKRTIFKPFILETMGAIGKLRGGAAAGAVALTTLFAVPACAQDAPEATPVSYTGSTEVSAAAASTATLIEAEVPRRDAFRASTEQIVYHVGPGIRGVEDDVVGLRNLGYQVTAFYGGEPGQVECFIDRMPCGEYDQATVFDGTMSGTAAVLYNQRLGEPTARRTSVAALNR